MPFPVTSKSFDLVLLDDDFLGASLNPAIAGTSENSGTAAIVVAKRGGVGGLVTGASSGNRSAFTTGLNHLVSDGSIVVQWRVQNITDVATRAIFVGLTDTVSLEMPIEISTATITSNATDAVGMYFDTDATTDVWRFGAVNADADKGTVADIVYVNAVAMTPSAGIYENFRVEVTPDGDATFFYGKDDGTDANQGWQQVGFIANAVATTALLTPVVCLETRTTSAVTAYVDALLIAGGRELD